MKEWDKKGLRFITDLFCKHTGSLLKREQIASIYNVKMTFMCYTALVKSIPAHITRTNCKMKTNLALPVLPFKVALLAKNKHTSREVYASLITALKLKHKGKSKLELKWTRDVGGMHLETMCDIRSATRNTYLQSLHYRISNRIIATNTFLYRIGKADNIMCTFCENVDDTLLHALWECSIVQQFIKDIFHWIKTKFNITLNVNAKNWFFPSLENESKLQKLIIILAKHTIVRSKNKNGLPNTNMFIASLRSEAFKEGVSALRHQRVNDLEDKWGNILHTLLNDPSR